MKKKRDALDNALPAGGKTLRLMGVESNIELHYQLYRYAEDIQQLTERYSALEEQHLELINSANFLLKSNEELNAVMTHSFDIHIITTIEGVILQVNPAALIIALSDQLIKSNLQNWVQKSHRAKYVSLILNTSQEQSCMAQSHEIYFHRAAGNAPLLIASVQIMLASAHGKENQLHWILRDITHLRETEFELAA
jgi:PAS domain S-box-containing protein